MNSNMKFQLQAICTGVVLVICIASGIPGGWTLAFATATWWLAGKTAQYQINEDYGGTNSTKAQGQGGANAPSTSSAQRE